MKFEIPFNADSDYQEKLFLWKYTYLKRLRATWFYLILLTALLLLVLLVKKTDFAFMFLTATILGGLFSYIQSLIALEKYKGRYLKATKERSEALKDTMQLYEFTEAAFLYSDVFLRYSISWVEFKEFKSSENIILLKRKYQENFSFTLSRREFGEDNFAKILAFLKTRLPQQGI